MIAIADSVAGAAGEGALGLGEKVSRNEGLSFWLVLVGFVVLALGVTMPNL